MNSEFEIDAENLEIARRWCLEHGDDWSVSDQAGRGGTAPVFGICSPNGDRALKIYDVAFSSGEKGEIEEKRIKQQIALGTHDCPYLIMVYDGGRFENRLFLLMNRAPGTELLKCLKDVPRDKIRSIVDQIAQACIFLQNNGLCHRDIKSENIFVTEDFGHATLLDISVLRNIHDPIGLGTDHDGKLPVVATARYSPPEYLFRLLEASPMSWHALNVYQLGGLLHDLIMREPLFQVEYRQSEGNRYRFAWAVATIDPVVRATDVDLDLVITARRALDKRWERRSQLSLEEFLADAETQRMHSLEALGLTSRGPPDLGQSSVASKLKRINDIAEDLENGIRDLLSGRGVTARHLVKPGANDLSKCLLFSWRSQGSEVVPHCWTVWQRG
jgi:serine/threonine-protein kinase